MLAELALSARLEALYKARAFQLALALAQSEHVSSDCIEEEEQNSCFALPGRVPFVCFLHYQGWQCSVLLALLIESTL